MNRRRYAITDRHRYTLLLLLMLTMSVSCGTLQVDLGVTPAPPGRPPRHITPTPNFDRPAYASEAGEIFEGGMKLVGYTVEAESGMAGSPLRVTLIWRVLDIIEANYHTFVHVVDEEGRMLARSEFPTGGGKRYSQDWIVDEYIYDQQQLRLPDDVTLDDVEIRVGLHDADDGQLVDLQGLKTYTVSTVMTPLPTAPAPLPTATPLPAETDENNPDEEHRTLRVAYIKNGNVWLWHMSSGARPLTRAGGVSDLWLSDDGAWIALLREGDIWVVDSKGGNERQLTHAEDFEDLQLPDELASSQLGTLPVNIAWRPGSHELFFSTSPQSEGMVLQYADDLWVIEVDRGVSTMVLPPGEGGKFIFSPDGQKMALITPGQIDLVDPGGANRRSVFTYVPVRRNGEQAYDAEPVWSSDSQSLRLAIPAEDGAATSIWHIPTNGEQARLMGQVMTVPGMASAPLFSPDLEQIAYLSALPALDDTAGSLPAIAISRLGEGGVEEPIPYPAGAIALRAWSPDSVRLLYRSPEAAVAEITTGQLATRDLLSSEGRHRVDDLRWVDQFRFLFIDYVGDGWQIRLAEISGRAPLQIDAATSLPTVYDHAWVPVSAAGS